jgi:lipid II isoglutaminyl synthase (glutamine-hydrolysing)
MAGRHGAALPGLVASRIDPTILGSLGRALDPVVFVIGTNGKTTTTRLISRILEQTIGVRPLSNRSGANLAQGLISAILFDGRRLAGPQPAVFEVDELAFPDVAAVLPPDVIVVLNLVRDQLDRYGEIDAVERRWLTTLATLDRDTRLVVCADDPRLETIARGDLPVRRFGLVGDPTTDLHAFGPDSSDVAAGAPCPRCGSPTSVDDCSPSLGAWRCARCGLERAPLDLGVRISAIEDDALDLEFEARAVEAYPSDDAAIADIARWRARRERAQQPRTAVARVGLTGTAGALDAAAAVLAATSVGASLPTAVAALNGATPAFGRLEVINVNGRRVILSLAKNPASAAQAVEAAYERHPDGILIGLGDRPADGRDVSWIWDAPIENLAALAPLTLTGDRADDLALRFKYAAPTAVDAYQPPVVDPSLDSALGSSLRRIRPGGTLLALGTYTTVLGLRQILERRGLAGAMPR